MNSPRARKDYFLQEVVVTKTNLSREDFIKKHVQGKKVLHVGFADWPITTTKKKNLHLSIAVLCERLDGVDINITDEIRSILSVPNGEIYDDWADVDDIYDVIIVPEVIEHVGNLEDFLKIIDAFSSQVIITAPDASQLKNNFKMDPQGYKEHVHPDHNYWFSPFTLQNVVTKYMTKDVKEMFWIKGSVAVILESK
jgi:hypothetical protein